MGEIVASWWISRPFLCRLTMRPFHGDLPFAVVADPEKHLYRVLGVESSLASVMDPRAWGGLVRGMFASHPQSAMKGEGGHMGLPADFVVARDGTVMHGLALIYVLRDLPQVAGFRIVQESLEHTRVQVVPGVGFDADTVGRIEHGLAARLGEGVRIEVEQVAEIAPEKSGKYRYVVSKVDASEVSCAT